MILLSEQSEIDADSRIDWLQQVLAVGLGIVDVTTDCVAGHLGSGKRDEQVFQVGSSRIFTQPQIV